MLHCFGHVEHSSGAVRTACAIQFDERRRPREAKDDTEGIDSPRKEE